ncbi:transcription repressor NadR [Clostridium chrysemydis]|uniref:transcription repressor NadR n=1 Tax=Clostridium chrysemydis TaxID=2665504 RepID=UPI0018843888|nr:transcription repressor NadR [Clostridium chrysemydis]
MDAKSRRDFIIKKLIQNNKPIKGIDFAKYFGVTRQIIVKDIALLRAKGNNILATPDGYIIMNEESKIKSIIAVNHDNDKMKDELECVIKYGGTIEDVIVEHPIYGEIKGILMIKNLNDLNKFMKKNEESGAKPLSELTDGVHLHTISTYSKEDMECIKEELKNKGFMII